MTTLTNPHAQRISHAHNSRGIVPPAATWNGGLSRTPRAVHTRVVVSSREAFAPATVKASRKARTGFSHMLLGGLLGFVAIAAMAVAPLPDAESEVAPVGLTVSSMQQK